MINYEKAGVNIALAERLVSSYAKIVRSTWRKEVRSDLTGYASLFQLSQNQFLAASTDGVGTKLRLAHELDLHTTIGIDLVAMCVNDLLCAGATPLFFLDYFATGKLSRSTTLNVLRGIAKGCKTSGMALVGGETAEMPGFYSAGEYDLAGFSVGLVQKASILPKRIPENAVLIGVASSGFHSNGYSLLRKLLPKKGKARRDRMRALLRPTKIYTQAVLPLIEKKWILGAAHITGSGFLNLPRLTTRVDYEISLPKASKHLLWVREKAGLSLEELTKTFNCGVGMVLVAKKGKEKAILAHLKRKKERAFLLGKTVKKKTKTVSSTVLLHLGSERAILKS